jgi:uncharacterized lipoprotein YmbA
MDEYHRWAEPLEKNFTRVLAGNLSELLATNRIAIFPERTAAPMAYRVVVDVVRFEGGPDGTVVLDARWSLSKRSGDQAVHTRNSCIRKSFGGVDDYAALVSAKSEALGDLSREIADGITALESKTSE